MTFLESVDERAGQRGKEALSNNSLSVWQIDLDDPRAQAGHYVDVLDAAERARATRFAFAGLRRRYIAAHAALRGILGQALHSSPEHIDLGADINGKPQLTQTPLPLRFNLSHSEGMALVAVSSAYEVGVDVQCWAQLPNPPLMVEHYFSASERKAFWSLAESERIEGFYRWWTLKEACLKAVGLGLRYPLAGFSVEFRPRHPPQLLDAPAELGALQLWHLPIAHSGWSAALAWAPPSASTASFTRQRPIMQRWSWHA